MACQSLKYELNFDNLILEVSTNVEKWLFMIIGLVVGLILGGICVLVLRSYYKKGLSAEQKKLKEDLAKSLADSEKIIANAQKEGESNKRELLLQAKEEISKARYELENEAREKRQEIAKERNRLEQKEENIERIQASVEKKQQEIEAKQIKINELEMKAREIEARKQSELEKVSGLSISDARALVLEAAEREYSHDLAAMLKQMEEKTKQDADRIAKDIIVNSIQRYASDYVSEVTVSVVNLPNDEMKGRIIGREGRNIRAIETITGVDLIIDDTPEAIILSSFDPIRREIARLTIEKLVVDGRIHPARIEEMVKKSEKELNQIMKQEGERAVFDTGVMNLNPELIKTLGRLKFRTSYGQNVLQHSIEVSWLAGLMAGELGLDVKLAKRAGLLHDIGKAVDFEQEGTHVQLGVDIARKYHESPDVTNAIEAHHGDVEPKTAVAVLVAAADAISAARPGARRENLETYIKRIEKLEEIATSFDGVEKSFAIQAGREIRVIVTPDKVSDDDMVILARRICKKIEEELSYPGQVKVNVIRETRASGIAK
ncbi:ribonucrease Y [Ruminococcaceae bacterium YRB3002]|nr:ribonucrease Y [Ruminococcaceae bacterium YRB3002]